MAFPMNLQTMAMTTLSVTMLLMLLTMTINKKKNKSEKKNSNFECGFNQKNSSMMPFSSQFFMVAILFLIFDLEISMFIPTMMSESKNMEMMSWAMMMMIILKASFLVEWKEGMLEWTKNKNKE